MQARSHIPRQEWQAARLCKGARAPWPTLKHRMEVASALSLMTGPSTNVGLMVTSSKPSAFEMAQAAFSASVCSISAA